MPLKSQVGYSTGRAGLKGFERGDPRSSGKKPDENSLKSVNFRGLSPFVDVRILADDSKKEIEQPVRQLDPL